MECWNTDPRQTRLYINDPTLVTVSCLQYVENVSNNKVRINDSVAVFSFVFLPESGQSLTCAIEYMLLNIEYMILNTYY